MAKKKNFIYKPIYGQERLQDFIDAIGLKVKKYFAKAPGCIIGLEVDGVFYAEVLYQWLKLQKLNLTFATMDDDGKGLDEKKLVGRKVLIVEDEIVTGKAYKRAMENIRIRRSKLNIKDLKFAVYRDRAGLADFTVDGYSAYAPWSLERLDVIDLKIIQALSEDGRSSFVEIAKKTGLTPVAIKNRVERLLADGVLKILGFLNMEKVYAVSAHIEIEADSKTVSRLVEKFEKSPLVYHLVKASGRYNLMLSIATPNLESIENFIAREIRSEPGVKHIEVQVGELPMIPKVWNPSVM